ncbi:MAG: LysR family transcriptional regulator [Bdellovibrionales bacterium]|nr:LysR family transcriptional regulator [Bdellovibrionales bacterium]
MNFAHIKSIDLNLLVIAAALFTHKNVSKAARELGMTQSAVSHALARLRLSFEDPLFVRTSKGLLQLSSLKIWKGNFWRGFI